MTRANTNTNTNGKKVVINHNKLWNSEEDLCALMILHFCSQILKRHTVIECVYMYVYVYGNMY